MFDLLMISSSPAWSSRPGPSSAELFDSGPPLPPPKNEAPLQCFFGVFPGLASFANPLRSLAVGGSQCSPLA